MFPYNPSPTFTAVAKIAGPGLPTPEPKDLAVVWKHKSQTAFAAWVVLPIDLAKAGKEIADADYLLDVMADWDAVDDAGDKVPLNAQTLASFLDAHHNSGRELVTTYIKALREHCLKN